MNDLKPIYDKVIEKGAKVQRIASEINELFREESEESILKAIVDKGPELDEAQNEYDEVFALYESMQKATRPNDIAKNFVPVSDTVTEPPEDSQPTVIKRAEYNKLTPVDRAKFIRSGGSIED
ncbi:MAG: hypothetical protein GYA45_11835 [Pelolinea sp.]|nr:hypothetical protein [Pelolinea sp.]